MSFEPVPFEKYTDERDPALAALAIRERELAERDTDARAALEFEYRRIMEKAGNHVYTTTTGGW